MVEHMPRFVCASVPYISIMWKHNDKSLVFTFIVDDFVVKYVGLDNSDNLNID